MKRYRSKPQEVEAVQYTGKRGTVNEFAGDKVSWDPSGLAYLLSGPDKGAQKWAWLPLGYWIVRKPGDTTDYWQVDPRTFDAEYKEVKEGGGKGGGKKVAKKGAKKAAQPAPKAAEPSPEEREDDGVLGAEDWSGRGYQ